MKTALACMILGAAAMAAGSGLLLAAPSQPPGTPSADAARPAPPGDARASAQPLAGTIESLNYGPRGAVEGFLLHQDDGSHVLINLPARFENAVSLSVGGHVSITAVPDDAPPGSPGGPGGPRARPGPRGGPAAPSAINGEAADRPMPPQPESAAPPPPAPDDLKPAFPVLRALSLTDPTGKQITDGPPQQTAVHLDAAVKSLNYDRHGMVNGALLDSGALLRIDPHDVAQLDLSPGKKLSIEGQSESTPAGMTAILASNVNGTAVRMPPPPPAPGREGPPPRADDRMNQGPDGGPPAPGDVPPPQPR